MPVLRELGAARRGVRLGVLAEQRDAPLDPVDDHRARAGSRARPRRRLGAARRSAPRAGRRAARRRRLRDRRLHVLRGLLGRRDPHRPRARARAPRDRAERPRARAPRARVARRAREATATDKPLFLWMHILEPHNWAVASGEPRIDEERGASSTIARSPQSDQMLGELLARVRERPPEQGADRDRQRRSRRGPRRARPAVSLDRSLRLADPRAARDRRSRHQAAAACPRPSASPISTPTVLELAGFAPPPTRDSTARSFAGLATGDARAEPRGRRRVRRDDQAIARTRRHGPRWCSAAAS